MTNLTNYHSHCLYCDGRANMEDFIRFAISEPGTYIIHIKKKEIVSHESFALQLTNK